MAHKLDVARNFAIPPQQAIYQSGRVFASPRGIPALNSRWYTHVEAAGADGTGPGGNKGICLLHVMVEPAAPDGGIALSGQVILHVVEIEGQGTRIFILHGAPPSPPLLDCELHGAILASFLQDQLSPSLRPRSSGAMVSSAFCSSYSISMPTEPSRSSAPPVASLGVRRGDGSPP